MSDTLTIAGAEGSLALVTGGTDGIGRELVRLLRATGWRVIATGRSASDGADPDDPALIWLVVDQSRPDVSAERIAAACEAHGGVELAVLCAGTGQLAQGGVEGAEAIRRTMRVNLEATVLITHALAGQILAANGTIAIVGSVARKGMADLPAYAASKAGLNGFARSLGEEWRGRASVLALHPGPTRTAMQAKAGLDVSRIAWAFMPSGLMARMMLARIDAARTGRRPMLATLGHRAGLLRALAERVGLARRSAR